MVYRERSDAKNIPVPKTYLKKVDINIVANIIPRRIFTIY